MEVIFGVQARDGAIRVQLSDDKVEELRKQLEGAFSGGDGGQIVWVTDKDGREFGIPTDKLAFVEFGTEKSSRQVGFSSDS
jgi:hypothetical protein